MTTNSAAIKAITTKKTFSRETAVAVNINATPEKVWALLTNAEGYPTWNSTILSIEGQIALGHYIKLKSMLDPKRTFKLKIKEMVPYKRMVWGDMMGTRVYELSPYHKGIRFSMREKIQGPLFPLFASMIPSFDESFEKFALDLKTAAEKNP